MTPSQPLAPGEALPWLAPFCNTRRFGSHPRLTWVRHVRQFKAWDMPVVPCLLGRHCTSWAGDVRYRRPENDMKPNIRDHTRFPYEPK